MPSRRSARAAGPMRCASRSSAASRRSRRNIESKRGEDGAEEKIDRPEQACAETDEEIAHRDLAVAGLLAEIEMIEKVERDAAGVAAEKPGPDSVAPCHGGDRHRPR